MRIASVLIPVLALLAFGCAGTNGQIDKNYLAYVDAVKAQGQPKIVELVAQPGQTIELKGVQTFAVYAGGQLRVEQYKPAPNEWIGVARDVIRAGMTVAGWSIAGNALENVVDSIGRSAGHNITGSYNTDRHDVTTTTTTTEHSNNTASFNADSNNDRHDVTTTNTDSGNTGSYNTDRHDVNDSNNDRHDINDSQNPTDNRSGTAASSNPNNSQFGPLPQ